jgi:hypothetical protein
MIPFDRCLKSRLARRPECAGDDLMKPDLISEVVLLSCGLLIVVTLIVTAIAALIRIAPRAMNTEQRTAAMTIARLIPVLAFLCLIVPAGAQIHASDSGNRGNAVSVVSSEQQASPDLRGTWSGTFISRNSDFSPFMITVKINHDSDGHLVGDASLVSDCLKNHRLHVRTNGSNVELAGRDADGDIVAFSGTVDSTGTTLKLNYIINGSPSGRCQIDDGTGTMAKL